MSGSSGARRRSARTRSALFAFLALLLTGTLYLVGSMPRFGAPSLVDVGPLHGDDLAFLDTRARTATLRFAALTASHDDSVMQPAAPLGAPLRTVAWPQPAPSRAQPLPPAQDTIFDEGIMELVADRLAPTTVVVLMDSAGSVLLPLEHVTYFLGMSRPGEAREVRVPRIGGGIARVDTVAFTITFPSHTVQLTPAEMTRRGDVVFLRVEHLEALLESDIDVDFGTLTVAFARDVPFPAQQRIIAEQRRAMLVARQRWLEQRREQINVPYQALSGGAIADWEIATGSIDPAELTVVRARAGVAAFGGDLGGGGALEMGRSVEDRFRDLSLHYHRVFPRSRYVSQLRLGDVITNGLFSRQVRGLELSNRPFLRSTELSSILLQPDLPPGWEYEVFQGNQLIGYSTIGASDAVAVPLRAGATPLQVRMYGPAGEEIVRTLLYQTPVSLLEQDAVEYTVGGGNCVIGCDRFAHADVRYGVHPLVTAGAGAEIITDSAGTALRPYFVYSLSTGTRATAELTYMPFSLYSANVGLFVREGSAAYLRGNLSDPGFSPVSVIGGDRMRWDAEASWDERLDSQRLFSQLRFGIASGGSVGEVQRFRVSATGNFRSGYLEARFDHADASSQSDLLTTRAAVFTPFSIRGRTLRPLVSSAIGVGSSGIALAEAALSVQPTAASLVTAGLQWNRGSAQPSFTLGYNVRTSVALASLRAISSASGNRSSSASFSGSAAISPDGDVSLHPATRTGYAGVSGTVFVDLDGNGSFSPGDEPVSEAHLVVGDRRVASDDQGRFHAWGLQPYQPIGVAIDSTRTADPSLTTVADEIIIRPVPNMARAIDVPLVRTRELVGSVTAETADIPVASLTIEITNLDSGAVTSTLTFSDGFFYVSRIRPGRYRLAISPASLRALGAVSAPPALEFSIPAAGQDLALDLPPLTLRR
jgi:hypothetical protein